MKTINLRNYRSHPNTPLVIFLGVLVLLFVVNALEGQPAQPVEIQPTAQLSYIMVIATARPTAQPDTQVQEEIEALRARIAQLEQVRIVDGLQQVPAPVYVEMAAPQAQPTMPPPTPEPVQLQTFAVQSDEEPLSPALLREAMDQ
jgi:hypothetical protein